VATESQSESDPEDLPPKDPRKQRFNQDLNPQYDSRKDWLNVILPKYFENLTSWEERQEQKRKAKLQLQHLDDSKPELKPETESEIKTEDVPKNQDNDHILQHDYGSETRKREYESVACKARDSIKSRNTTT
jgi:hypothetical protein